MLKKKYQLWLNYGVEGWRYEEYDTLEECLCAQRYQSEFVITKKVDFEILEKQEDEE